MNDNNRIDGALFAAMVKGGAVNLRNNAQTVNELNVFPIPDGDTGENMARTIEGGAAAVSDINEKDISKVAGVIARGMLLSARGNSGVILSQFFDGIKKGVAGFKEIGVAELKTALACGVKQAYSAVVKPTEGTILTVMREAGEKTAHISDDAPLKEYFEAYIDELYASLDRTPELLPILKQSDVIDSGGAGLVYIVEGMYRALTGEDIAGGGHAATEKTAATDSGEFDENSTMEFGYCTELIVQLMAGKTDPEAYDVNELIKYLESMGGESIVAFKTGTRIKLHVHTFEPDKVLAYCLKIGEFVTVKVENMSIQHSGNIVRNRFERQPRKNAEIKRKKYACVVVADGEGLIEQFRSLGADGVVDGKQTMNPSTQDFIAAFDEAGAEVIFVLPNNSNVILAANQAAEMYTDSRVIVIPTKTLAQGYSAMSMLDYTPDDADEIAEALISAAEGVTTGLVTYSIRDCVIGDKTIKKGDFLGFSDKELVAVAKDVVDCSQKLLDAIDMTGKSVIVAIRGKDNADDATVAAIGKHLDTSAPDVEFYEFVGGQDVYSFIFVVE